MKHLSLVALLTASVVLAAPAPRQNIDVIKDRAGFIPHRKYFALPGKVIGVLASDVRAMMGQEGRSGPAKAYGFSAGGGSYRWVYTPAQDKSIIQNLQVKVGEKGDRIKVYPALNMADPDTIKQWNIAAPYALVEIEVNDGLGAPPDEAFVATGMTRLDGADNYPLKLPDIVSEAKKLYQRHLDDEKMRIETVLTEAIKTHLNGQKPTGPRETAELFYITWLPERERVRIHFQTKVSEGALQTGIGIEPVDRPRPLPLPPPRGGGGPFGFFPPAPPMRPLGARVGSLVGVELGLALEYTKSGKLDRVLTLPAQAFHHAFLAPPATGRPRGGPGLVPRVEQ